MEGAEEDRSGDDPEFGLQRSPKKGFFAYTREHRDQDQLPTPSTFHELRGELAAELAQRRQRTVKKNAQDHGAAGGKRTHAEVKEW